MALTQRLEFRQSQSLVMTPQLMQAIKLLQLSNLDLTTYVEEELERNPLLERAESEGPTEPPETFARDREDGGGDETAGAADGSTAPDDWSGQDVEIASGTIDDKLDTDLDNVFP